MTVTQTEIDAMIFGSSLDEYGLKDVPFVPDVFYDIGANIGGVTLLAAELFPNTKIIAVEPQPDNYAAMLQVTGHLPNVVRLNKALGLGPVYQVPESPGTGNWIFVNETGPSYTESMIPADVESVTLSALMEEYGGDKVIVKLDCESGELMVLYHEPSKQALLSASWIGIEFHLWGATHELHEQVVRDVTMFLYELAKTHNVKADLHGECVNLIAGRRE